MAVLSEVLKTNSTLTEINLAHNQIKEKGMKLLFESLKSSPTLKELHLCNAFFFSFSFEQK